MKKTVVKLIFPILLLSVGCKTASTNCGSISGYQIVTEETPLSNTTIKQLEVKCPDGKYAVGAGWSVEDSTSAILDGEATYFQPSYDGKSWLVNAKNNSAFSPSWKLKVRCICADVCDSVSSKTEEVLVSDSTKRSE